MSYRQDEVERTCEICQNKIAGGELMLDLFRKQSSRPNPSVRVVWVHEVCAKTAIEVWLTKKWAKTSSQQGA